MKKMLLLVAIMMIAILSCESKKEEAKGGEKVLRVGLNAEFAPFEYMQNGEIVGFDIDLLNEVSKNVGFKVEYVNQSFDGLIPALKAGKIDMIASGMSATEERKKSVDFTDDYFKSVNVYLRKKGNTALTTKESLVGKRIGAALGTIQEAAAKEIENATVISNEATTNVLMELNAGKTDSVILDKIVAYEYLKTFTDLEVFYEDDDSIGEGMAYAFDKGKQTELIAKINEELKKLKENGKYDEIAAKYGLN